MDIMMRYLQGEGIADGDYALLANDYGGMGLEKEPGPVAAATAAKLLHGNDTLFSGLMKPEHVEEGRRLSVYGRPAIEMSRRELFAVLGLLHRQQISDFPAWGRLDKQ